jgi:hypothetical protein
MHLASFIYNHKPFKRYVLRPGLTKEQFLQTLLTRNKGKRAYSELVTHCLYEDEEGNHCGVGCFIPDGHPGMRNRGGVGALLKDHPDLVDKMPLLNNRTDLRAARGLTALQSIHDTNTNRVDIPDNDGYFFTIKDMKHGEELDTHERFRFFTEHCVTEHETTEQ